VVNMDYPISNLEIGVAVSELQQWHGGAGAAQSPPAEDLASVSRWNTAPLVGVKIQPSVRLPSIKAGAGMPGKQVARTITR